MRENITTYIYIYIDTIKTIAFPLTKLLINRSTVMCHLIIELLIINMIELMYLSALIIKLLISLIYNLLII